MKLIQIILIILLNFSVIYSYDYKYEIMKNLEYFPIKEKNLWGLIDTTGNVILKPKYNAVGVCSEGLIPVRKNGFYGYITPKDSLVIKFQFDEAEEFYNGIARVIYHGQPNLIDKTGNILFEHNYKDIKHYGLSNCFVAQLDFDKYCFINRKGDKHNKSTFRYRHLNSFNDKAIKLLSGGENIKFETDTESPTEALIDENGKYIAPFGLFTELGEENEGLIYFKTIPDSLREQKIGFMNIKGEEQFYLNQNKIKQKDFEALTAYIDGVLYVENYDSLNNSISYLDKKGNVILSNKNWVDGTTFNNVRAFVKERNGLWYFIDKKGIKINETGFDKIESYYDEAYYFSRFKKTTCFSFKTDSIYVINFDGIISKQIPKDLCKDLFNYSSNYIRNTENSVYSFNKHLIVNHGYVENKKVYLQNFNICQYQLYDIENQELTNIKFDFIDYDYVNILKVYNNELLSYINRDGKIIWSQSPNDTLIENLEPLNINYKRYSYYSTHPIRSKYVNDLNSNIFNDKKYLNKNKSLDNKVFLYIDTNHKSNFQNNLAYKFYLINNTKDTFSLIGIDDNLNIQIQALDEFAVWRDIESYLPNYMCFRSDKETRKLLPENKYVDFDLPVFSGSYKTKVRIKLQTDWDFIKKHKVVDLSNKEMFPMIGYTRYKREFELEDLTIYSNEVEMYINSNQFKDKLFAKKYFEE